MIHNDILATTLQGDSALAITLRQRLVQFLRPVAERLATKLDIRLVQTALDLVQAIITHRHGRLSLLLTELGGYLLEPAHAPAGTKRISNLLQAADWAADDLNAVLWQQASARVQALEAAGEDVLAVWDGSVWEKPESQAAPDWCVVRSAKARRLARRRKGMTLPLKGAPILVPGLHWDGVAVVGMTGAPTLAHMEWWTTRGEHATTQRAVDQRLLERCAQAWGGATNRGTCGPTSTSPRSRTPGRWCRRMRGAGRSKRCGATAKANWPSKARGCGTGRCAKSCCCWRPWRMRFCCIC